MYYKKPLAPGETSSAFFSNIRFSENMDNNYTDTAYHVEVTVTGVQANNAENAIASELGVFAEFDGDGNITSIVGVR
jgi:hypothetical protein